MLGIFSRVCDAQEPSEYSKERRILGAVRQEFASWLSSSAKKLLRRRGERILGARLLVYPRWYGRGFASPAPQYIKRRVLDRYGIPGAMWLETGTYRGDTTEYLAKRYPRVYSIEPSPSLYEVARKRLSGRGNVTLINASSETAFGSILEHLSSPVCFWLDGHYSGGETFQADTDTPVVDELAAISLGLTALRPVAVFIDDFRCFEPENPQFEDYPTKSWLVQWAVDNELAWTVEHDIFIAYSS